MNSTVVPVASTVALQQASSEFKTQLGSFCVDFHCAKQVSFEIRQQPLWDSEQGRLGTQIKHGWTFDLDFLFLCQSVFGKDSTCCPQHTAQCECECVNRGVGCDIIGTPDRITIAPHTSVKNLGVIFDQQQFSFFAHL